MVSRLLRTLEAGRLARWNQTIVYAAAAAGSGLSFPHVHDFRPYGGPACPGRGRPAVAVGARASAVMSSFDRQPFHLLIGKSHETGHIVGQCDAFAPVGKIESRNEVDLDGAPDGVRTGGLAVIMIGKATDAMKTDAALFKEP